MNKYDSSEIVRDQSGKQYHIGLRPEEISNYIMLVGDPDRAKRVADLFDDIKYTGQNREYITYTGKYKNIELTVMSTGIGCDNTEIAVIELCQLKFPLTIIRCGTCGALQDDINIGDVVISSGALRLENTSTFFVEESYPAIASHEIILALLKSADDNKIPHHLGITATTSSFYGGQSRHVPGFPLKDENMINRITKQNIKNFEMETSTLLTLASLRGFRAGSVCVVFASRTKNKFVDPMDKEKQELKGIKTALEAFINIDKMDKEKGNSKFWLPKL